MGSPGETPGWHRVVNREGKPTSPEPGRQRELLEQDEVRFRNGVVDMDACLWDCAILSLPESSAANGQDAVPTRPRLLSPSADRADCRISPDHRPQRLCSSDLKLPTPDKSIAGVDGCKRGWVMVRRDEEGRFTRRVFEALRNLPKTDFVLIDIPIGLPARGRRDCDLEARRILGGMRGRSVFTGTRRPLLLMQNRECAHAWGRNQDGLGVNQQLWYILPKIREADDLIRSASGLNFHEGHPELSFYAAAGQPMKYNKKQKNGRYERLRALTGFIDDKTIDQWLRSTPGSGAACDDILDALALCRSAARLALGCHRTLPANPPKDDFGLTMEMVF